MKAKNILNFVEELKNTLKTNDPYEIAEYYGIKILHRDSPVKDFTAYTMKFPNYPTIISINNAYTDFSKKLLCAHELGHALIHEGTINHFRTTGNNMAVNVEQEANLFAIALVSDGKISETLGMPLESMNNYLLKTIMDYNLKFKGE
ncbi:MAG: ImmA/IrrE family metallo-endopeptidase [Lachnospiraceae bacterium]|nr:ImmA/IrrE family metallo-endopeptidase [Lachnospiraceae bacterium]